MQDNNNVFVTKKQGCQPNLTFYKRHPRHKTRRKNTTWLYQLSPMPEKEDLRLRVWSIFDTVIVNNQMRDKPPNPVAGSDDSKTDCKTRTFSHGSSNHLTKLSSSRGICVKTLFLRTLHLQHWSSVSAGVPNSRTCLSYRLTARFLFFSSSFQSVTNILHIVVSAALIATTSCPDSWSNWPALYRSHRRRNVYWDVPKFLFSKVPQKPYSSCCSTFPGSFFLVPSGDLWHTFFLKGRRENRCHLHSCNFTLSD